MDKEFWKGKKVFVTGHTGFKGSWLCIILHMLGAKVTGYSLKPKTRPNLYNLASVQSLLKKSIIADINNYIGSFHKNHQANLANICKPCHEEVTKNKIIHRKTKTTEGFMYLEQ